MNGIASFCSAHGLRLEKSLGQHFLVDPRVLERIVEAANLRPTDHVVEIGAGIGVLTKELLKRAGKVTAIELDARLIPLLEEYILRDAPPHGEMLRDDPRCRSGLLSMTWGGAPQDDIRKGNLTIVHGDALRTPLPTTPYKVVANIPYEITSPLLERLLLQADSRPVSLTFLLQREVAEKICATDNRLGILVQIFGKPRIVCRIPRAAFLPPPKVESALVHIACFAKSRVEGAALTALLEFARVAYAGKRKMLRGTMGRLPHGMEILTHANIDPTRRPETLSIEEWVRLTAGSPAPPEGSPRPRHHTPQRRC